MRCRFLLTPGRNRGFSCQNNRIARGFARA